MLALLATLAAPLALAGDLVIDAPPMARVFVDGQALHAQPDGRTRRSQPLDGGQHLVEVYGRQGQLRHQEWVAVPVDARVHLRAEGHGLATVLVEWMEHPPHGHARPAPQRPPPVVVIGPPPPVAMPEASFQGLLRAVHAEPFGDDKLLLIAAVSDDHRFTIAQVGALMDAVTFSSEKVEVARMLRHRVIDPENAWALNAHLTFSSDKQEVQRLFA